MDHKPLLNLLQDRSRTINNKRLTNLRRKCDGFLFKIGYGRGVDNTTDALSRIQDWSKKDPERLEPVEDSRDIDDDSSKVHATEVINKTDLDEVMEEVNALEVESRMYNHDVANAILGSWFTTPKQSQLQFLLKMYGNSNPNSDERLFKKWIQTGTNFTIQNWMFQMTWTTFLGINMKYAPRVDLVTAQMKNSAPVRKDTKQNAMC